jgi:putative ABC transport system ATP-binding protein
MALFEELYQRGNTIILVTHEEDIAKYSHRVIKLLDGKIKSDEPNTPISMEDHLARLANL